MQKDSDTPNHFPSTAYFRWSCDKLKLSLTFFCQGTEWATRVRSARRACACKTSAPVKVSRMCSTSSTKPDASASTWCRRRWSCRLLFGSVSCATCFLLFLFKSSWQHASECHVWFVISFPASESIVRAKPLCRGAVLLCLRTKASRYRLREAFTVGFAIRARPLKSLPWLRRATESIFGTDYRKNVALIFYD